MAARCACFAQSVVHVCRGEGGVGRFATREGLRQEKPLVKLAKKIVSMRTSEIDLNSKDINSINRLNIMNYLCYLFMLTPFNNHFTKNLRRPMLRKTLSWKDYTYW